MSWSDPIADMLTRVRNAQKAHLPEVSMPVSKMKRELARVFKAEGYIADCTCSEDARELRLTLKYGYSGDPAIRGLRRDSRPGLRRYCGSTDIPQVLGGMGVAIISTSSGVMSGKEARERKLGGEWLCSVW